MQFFAKVHDSSKAFPQKNEELLKVFLLRLLREKSLQNLFYSNYKVCKQIQEKKKYKSKGNMVYYSVRCCRDEGG